ncbi:MAG: hypothetical protein ACOC9X_04500 [bacterium]
MPYTITEQKQYPQSPDEVLQAALGAVEGLQGKVLNSSDSQVEAKFDKKIHGKVLGDRTHLKVTVSNSGSGVTVDLEAYPIDPVGRKLQFGARKGVTRTVVDWYWAHLEHRLV